MKEILKTIKKKELKKLLNDKFSKHVIRDADDGKEIEHGKVTKIITNTHSNLIIVKFEHGNEFIPLRTLDFMINRYLGSTDKNINEISE